MKKATLVLLLAICTVALTSQSACAGTGKGLKSKIQVKNVNAANGRAITIFVVPEGTLAPKTKADALKLTRKNVGGAKTETFKLQNGSYTVAAADTQGFNSLANSDPIPVGGFTFRPDVVLNSNTRIFAVNTAGSSPAFTPAIH